MMKWSQISSPETNSMPTLWVGENTTEPITAAIFHYEDHEIDEYPWRYSISRYDPDNLDQPGRTFAKGGHNSLAACIEEIEKIITVHVKEMQIADA